ncbi:MAG: hypothetical protein WCK11_00165 [Candidatus Falkowbacteria bacterium]
MDDITIREVENIISEFATKKGLGINPEEINTPEKFVLLHSEVSEAYEAYRRGRMDGKDGLSEELADIAIRLFQLAIIFKIDLGQEIVKKIDYNQHREWQHPNETIVKNNV